MTTKHNINYMVKLKTLPAPPDIHKCIHLKPITALFFTVVICNSHLALTFGLSPIVAVVLTLLLDYIVE